MGGVVIENPVHVEFGGHLAVDHLQELLELDRAVAGVRPADHLALGELKRGEQARGAVTLVVTAAAALACPAAAEG
jgi:hypothetical protein